MKKGLRLTNRGLYPRLALKPRKKTFPDEEGIKTVLDILSYLGSLYACKKTFPDEEGIEDPWLTILRRPLPTLN